MILLYLADLLYQQLDGWLEMDGVSAIIPH